MTNYAIKVRLYPNKKQQEIINQTVGSCRSLYNKMLAERQEVYSNLKDDKEALKNHTYKTEKQYKEEFDYLSIGSSRALQQSRKDLDTAYKNFFKHKSGFPKFKSKHTSKWSYREPQVGSSITIEDNKIKLLKLGKVKVRGLNSRYKGEKICSATITRTRDNQYYCSVLVQAEPRKKKRAGNKVIGIDLGLKEMVVSSSGQFFKPIKLEVKRLENKVKQLQRKLARQSKGSNRRRKTKERLVRAYRKLTNKKSYFHWHLANKLCSENQAISLETLAVKNMIKNRKLSHAIHTTSWSSFLTKLEQKAEQYGTNLHYQSRWFASSKTCYKCGYINKKLTLADRYLDCYNCHFKIDRDLQASLNLEQKISAEYVDYRRGEEIRPTKLSFDFAGTFVETSTNKVVYV